MSTNLRGEGHIDFGADPIGVGVGFGIGMTLSCLHTFMSAHYLVNQWLDFFQIFMDILSGHNKEQIKF